MSLTQSPSLFIVGDLRFSMWIPSELAGLVVGKKGSTISTIQQETKTKLLEARKPIGSSLWSPVIIHGEPNHVYAAYKAIADMVDNEVDDVVAEFLIDKKKHFFLIGKRRDDFIKILSAKANVRVWFPDKDAFQSSGTDRPKLVHGTLEGRCEDVYKALDILENEYVLSQNREEYAAKTSLLAVMAATLKPTTSLKQSQDTKSVSSTLPTSSLAKDSLRKSTYETSVTKEISTSSSVVGNNNQVDNEVENKNVPVLVVPPVLPKEKTISSDPSPTKSIVIPASLVGLLLSRRPSTSASNVSSVMNRIQHATGTRISRTGPPPPPKAPKSNETNQEKSNTKKSTEQENNRRRRRHTSHSDDEDDDGDDVEDEEIVSDEEDDSSSSVKPDSISTEPVEFRIIGSPEGISQAATYLERMISGDRIKDVLISLSKDTSKSRPVRLKPQFPQTAAGKAKQTPSVADDKLEKPKSAEEKKEDIPDKSKVKSKKKSFSKPKSVVIQHGPPSSKN